MENEVVEAAKPEYQVVSGLNYCGYSEWCAAIEKYMAEGWVLIGGAHPYETSQGMEFAQTMARNFHSAQD